MVSKTIINSFRVSFGALLRSINDSVLYRWVLYFKSQPLVVSQKSAMVFSPHQDDETLGCGGLIAMKRQMGVPVEVIFLTDGRYGKPDWITPDDIVDIRRQEAMNALSILGIQSSEANFLNYLDGSLQNLSDEKRKHLIEQLTQRIKTFMPEEIYVPYHQDGHADHNATYYLVQEAIAASEIATELLQYPIWMFWQNPLSPEVKPADISDVYKLAISSVHERKKQAIATYQSQLPGLPNCLIRRFYFPYEIFFKH